MEKQKKSVGAIALVILLLIVTIVSLILATYAWAKYTTTTTGQATATVAQWDVSGSTSSRSRWTQSFSHAVAERVAPGTSGVIPVTFDAGNTEVDVSYTITVTGVTGKPTNVKFYDCQASGTENNMTYTRGAAKAIGTASYQGTIAYNASPKSVTKYIYWEWEYNSTTLPAEADVTPAALKALRDYAAAKGIANASGLSYNDLVSKLTEPVQQEPALLTINQFNDIIDTADGEDNRGANGANTMTVSFKIDAVQVNPTDA